MIYLVLLLQLALMVAQVVVFAHIVLSWVHASGTRPRWLYHPFVYSVEQLGTRILTPFRRLFRTLGVPTSPLDFSPMLALFTIWVLQRAVVFLMRV